MSTAGANANFAIPTTPGVIWTTHRFPADPVYLRKWFETYMLLLKPSPDGTFRIDLSALPRDCTSAPTRLLRHRASAPNSKVGLRVHTGDESKVVIRVTTLRHRDMKASVSKSSTSPIGATHR